MKAVAVVAMSSGPAIDAIRGIADVERAMIGARGTAVPSAPLPNGEMTGGGRIDHFAFQRRLTTAISTCFRTEQRIQFTNTRTEARARRRQGRLSP